MWLTIRRWVTGAFAGDELRYTAASSTANPAESAVLVWKRAR
jgi:hypothetical protein